MSTIQFPKIHRHYHAPVEITLIMERGEWNPKQYKFDGALLLGGMTRVVNNTLAVMRYTGLRQLANLTVEQNNT